MAQYDHLPVFRAAYDLALSIDRAVHGWSRYHKYTSGAELRTLSRSVLKDIIAANDQREPAERLLLLKKASANLEMLKIMLRLAHDGGGCSSRKEYLHLAAQMVEVTKQLSGWKRSTNM